MRGLREDIVYAHRSWRLWLRDEQNKQVSRRFHRMNLMVIFGAALGAFALVTADDVVELVLGIGILTGPAIIVGFYAWFAWKLLRAVHAHRKAGWRLP